MFRTNLLTLTDTAVIQVAETINHTIEFADEDAFKDFAIEFSVELWQNGLNTLFAERLEAFIRDYGTPKTFPTDVD